MIRVCLKVGYSPKSITHKWYQYVPMDKQCWSCWAIHVMIWPSNRHVAPPASNQIGSWPWRKAMFGTSMVTKSEVIWRSNDCPIAECGVGFGLEIYFLFWGERHLLLYAFLKGRTLHLHSSCSICWFHLDEKNAETCAWLCNMLYFQPFMWRMLGLPISCCWNPLRTIIIFWLVVQ